MITGHDRDEIGVLVFPTPQATALPPRRAAQRAARQAARRCAPRAAARRRCPARALLLDEPPSLDAGEITDKGYINQRAVLERRARQGRAAPVPFGYRSARGDQVSTPDPVPRQAKQERDILMLELLTDPQAWIAFATLTALELVLGIDNIIFISILVDKLPPERREFARRIGLFLAMFMRIGLLLVLAWIVGLVAPLFTRARAGASPAAT